MATAIPRAGGAMIRGAGKVLSQTGKLIGAVLPSGMRVNRKGMIKLAKQIGLEAAAVALGITAVELAQVIAEEASKPRRRRGITAAQLANARSTNRRILSMAKSLGFQCRPTSRVGK